MAESVQSALKRLYKKYNIGEVEAAPPYTPKLQPPESKPEGMSRKEYLKRITRFIDDGIEFDAPFK